MGGFEKLPNGSRIYTDAEFAVQYDSVLLAEFSLLPHSARVLDLCAGSGFFSLWLADGGHVGEIVAAEINEAALSLFERSIADGGFENIVARQCDARTYTESRKFDAVICNPPYFQQGERSPTPARALARHADSFTAADMCKCARRNLKQGGRLVFCFPAPRCAEIFAGLNENGLAPARVRFVRAENAPRAYLMLCEARYGRECELAVLPQLVTAAQSGGKA